MPILPLSVETVYRGVDSARAFHSFTISFQWERESKKTASVLLNQHEILGKRSVSF